MNEYRKYTNLGRVKLTKNDLVELVTLVKSDLPITGMMDSFSIKTSISDLNISENDLESFLQHKGIPKTIDNIFIRISSGGRMVYLTLGNDQNFLSVAGSDQTWVLGKYMQLLGYIKAKQPVLSFITKPISFGLIIGIISNILFNIIYVLQKSGWHSINPLLVISIFPCVLILYSITRIKNTKIIIRESQSFSDKYGVAITIVLSFLTLIATVVLGVIQIIQK
ncbi:MAG TPA: hypothetical protein VF411_09125 [Bacteroidia bacterium]